MVNSIAIVIYQSNIFNNPSILSIIKEANKRGQHVFILTKKKQLYPLPSNFENVSLYYLPSYEFIKRGNFKTFLYLIKLVFKLKLKRVKTIVGVDSLGLLSARLIRKWCPGIHKFYYLSFELLFADELLHIPDMMKIKNEEKIISRQVDGILIQDKFRKHLLKQENQIPEKVSWFFLPVSQSITSFTVQSKSKLEYQALGIPENKITLITSGTIGEWMGMNEIITGIKDLKDSDYWFVIHDRNGFQFLDSFDQVEIFKELKKLADQGYPISISKSAFFDTNEYLNFLSLFDVGIGLYVPTYRIPEHGKNIYEIGLSSGKLNSYLSIGMPVIFSASSSLSELNKIFPFGFEVTEKGGLSKAIKSIPILNLRSYSVSAKFVFNKYIHPDPFLNVWFDDFYKMKTSDGINP